MNTNVKPSYINIGWQYELYVTAHIWETPQMEKQS